MTAIPDKPEKPAVPDKSLEQTLEAASLDDNAGPRPADAVTDCGVTPGHNRLEDCDGA